MKRFQGETLGAVLSQWQAHAGLLSLQDNPPYDKGAFRIEINFPAEYPFKPPKITFKTKIYHPNIDEKGQVCLPVISAENWKPATKTDQGKASAPYASWGPSDSRGLGARRDLQCQPRVPGGCASQCPTGMTHLHSAAARKEAPGCAGRTAQRTWGRQGATLSPGVFVKDWGLPGGGAASQRVTRGLRLEGGREGAGGSWPKERA